MRDESVTTNRAANHPKADLLSAFAEKALAGAERAQIVDHLAGCARCREIVFLTQQAAPAAEPDAASLPLPAPARGLRKFPWLPVAASGLAVCLLVGSFVWFRSLGHFNNSGASGTETAAVQPVPQSAPEPAPQPTSNSQAETAPHEASRPAPSEAPRSGARKAPPSAPKAHPAAALHGSIAQGQALPAMEVGATNSTDQLQAELTYRRRAEDKGAIPTAGAISPVNGLFEQSSASAPVAAAPASPSHTFVSVSAQATVTGNVTQAAGAAPSRGTVSASLHGAGPVILLLPGGHTAVSSTRIPGRILALDAEGALFASDDMGRNWRAISLPWTGKAVAFTRLAPEESANAATAELAFRKSKAQHPPDSIEIRLASGERWISHDRGESWTAIPNPIPPPN